MKSLLAVIALVFLLVAESSSASEPDAEMMRPNPDYDSPDEQP